MAMEIEIFSKDGCKWCDRLKEHLHSQSITFAEVKMDPSLESYSDERDALIARAGGEHRTFPFVFVNGDFVGGHDAMMAFLEKRSASVVFDEDF